MRVTLYAKRKPDAGGALPLYIRVSHQRVERLVALGLRVPAADWNPKRHQVRRSNPEHFRLNELLEARLRVATAAAEAELSRRGRNVTADRLKAAVERAVHPEAQPEGKRPVGVVELGRRMADEKQAKGKPGTAMVYRTAMTNLEASLALLYGAPDLPVGDVTAEVVRSHERRLSAPEPLGMGHAVNYVNRQLRTLRTVLRRAAADGEPGADVAAQAIGVMRFKTERVAKKRLSRAEVQTLEEARPALTGRRRDVLDWWLFCFYAGGMRFGDLLTLRWDQIERDAEGVPVYARWRMRKTGDAQGVPLLRQPAEILLEWEGRFDASPARAPWVFGMVTEAVVADPERLFRETHRWSAIARKHLRLVAEQTGTQYVGFHGSRHSLADHLRKSGVPVPTISHVLGHSSLAVTERYLAGFDRQGVEDALRGALGD